MSDDDVQTALQVVTRMDFFDLKEGPHVDLLTQQKTQTHAAYVTENTLQHILVFRTTVTPLDVLHDLDMRMTQFHGAARVHRGFYRKYISLRENIIDIVTRKAPKRLLVTGHSMGGALACMAALDLNLQFEDLQVDVVTFGSPRVGNRQFMDMLHSTCERVTRVRDPRDMVPYIPFMALGFTHGYNDHQATIHDWISSVTFMVCGFLMSPRRFHFFHLNDVYQKALRSGEAMQDVTLRTPLLLTKK